MLGCQPGFSIEKHFRWEEIRETTKVFIKIIEVDRRHIIFFPQKQDVLASQDEMAGSVLPDQRLMSNRQAT
jgi:hypothetical protein